MLLLWFRTGELLMTILRLPDLKELKTFTCLEVISKFSRDNGVTEAESRMLFKETMKMLWLMVKHQLESVNGTSSQIPETFNIHKPMDPLDKMWHEFILFTREYHQFCDEYFGCYLHHVPCSEREFQAFRQRALEQKDDFVELERKSIGVFAKYIQTNLGNETLRTWFMELPKI